jgi:hypothetical protein
MDAFAQDLAASARERTNQLPSQVFPRLTGTYKKLFNGSSLSGGIVTNGANLVRVTTFGDSVGTSKTIFIIQRLQQATQNGGSMFNTRTATLGASNVDNVADTTNWINGSWDVVPSGGRMEYALSGGGVYATKLYLFYRKKSGDGTFKVQTHNGSVWADEASYTNVDANNATTTVGVITLTKASTSAWKIAAVGLTGSVIIIGAAWADEGATGVAWYDFSAGGLELALSQSGGVATPVNIVNGVLTALAPDMGMMEWKDNSAFPAAFTSFMANYKANVSTTTDWVFVGTSPRADATTQALEDANDNVMKAYADANGHFFFSSRSLLTYAQMVALGWQGDGIHPAEAYHAYVAAVLWAQLGFDNASFLGTTKELSTTNGRVKTTLTFGARVGREFGSIGKDSFETDLIVKGIRGVAFCNYTSGLTKAWIDTSNNGWGIQSPVFSIVSGLTITGPAIRALGATNTSGGYMSGLNSTSTWAPWGASQFIIGSSAGPTWSSGTGSPEGAVTAPIGSKFSRTDGGVGSTLYYKSSGTGNTGWTAVA